MIDAHRGEFPTGPLQTQADPRIQALDTSLRHVEAVLADITPGLTPARDPFRANVHQTNRLQDHGQFFLGTILHAIPHVGWYKVQTGTSLGAVPGVMLSHSGFTPLGVRDTGSVPPNSQVLGYMPNGFNTAFLFGVVPPDLRDGTIVNPDFVVPGGQSGYKREPLHKFPWQGHYRKGHVRDFSGQRPVDATAFEWGKMGITGVGITIDDYLAQLRVNEMTGIFMTLFDSWCKLTGYQLDIDSSVHSERYRDDEGEARNHRGDVMFPWEGLGLYDAGEDITQIFGDVEVQYQKARAKIDIKEGEEDLQPIYRWQEWKGYEGQGSIRQLNRPAKDSGKQFYKDKDPVAEGLFTETISADGAFALRSAKSVYIGRRVKQIVPKEIKLPEDKKGDDAEEDNYKFSSKFGGGEEHKLKEIKIEGEHKQLRRLAAIQDLIAFGVNWKVLHPFHYHKLDYSTKQESEQNDRFQKVNEKIDFAELEDDTFLSDPEPVMLKIDHRYNEVEFFQRESFIYFTDDGGVILAAGQGESLILGSGSARLSAPGDVQLTPGRTLIGWAEQISLRAKRSVDVSATEHDVSIKAEGTTRIVGGVGGTGGVFIESKAPGRTQQYKDKIGEEIDGRGVVIKAPNSMVGLYGKELYLRSGGGDLGDGHIVIDAARGNKNVEFKAREFNFYCPKQVNFYYGPVDDTSKVNQTYTFGDKFCLMDVKLLLGGKLIGYTGGGGRSGVLVDGPVLATKSIACGGSMADKKGFFLGKVPGNFASTLLSLTSDITEVSEVMKGIGEIKHQSGIVERLYQSDQPGDNTTIENMQFSFRDADDESQYGTKKFKWLESRWEQMVRLGMATGGKEWKERKVTYQGKELYPYPGRKKLTEEPVSYQLTELKMYDAAAGYSKDRPGPYEEPELADWDTKTLNDSYKLIR
jgi:hypothetical protein